MLFITKRYNSFSERNETHQIWEIRGFKDKETHGGADVFLGAIGQGAEQFSGSLENVEVNHLIRKITGL